MLVRQAARRFPPLMYVFVLLHDADPRVLLLTERNQALIGDDTGGHQWAKKSRSASLYKNMGSFCCICRPNYL
jgi:hypothetical protein